VLSSASGTAGEARNGRFVILDPRTTFHVPADTKIIVSFQWVGTPGKHHLTGIWKGPGGVTSTSSFDYVAPDREFGGYWSIPVTAEAPEGAWTFEADVEGTPAGTRSFEIVHGDAEAPVTAAAPRPLVPLTRQEMFALALAATVTVEGLDAAGKSITKGPAAIIDGQTFVTAFAVVNGASKLLVRAGSGPSAETASVLAWDRRRDFAILRVPGVAGVTPPGQAPALPAVGAPCVTVNAGSDGAYSVTAGDVVGVNDYPDVGTRLSVSLYNSAASPGAPVLDEFGRLVGVVSAGLYPGAGYSITRMAELGQVPPTMVVPLSALSAPAGAPGVTLTELAGKGVFTPAITRSRDVMSAGLAAGILKDGARTQPIDQKSEFSLNEKEMTTFVNSDPKGTIKSLAVVRIYNFDNQLLGETKPLKINLRTGSLSMSIWKFGVPPKEGVYRVDVLLDTDVVWRGYFRVVK
jgi:hypothetical protein